MVDMESAVHTGKHKKINSGGTAENRKYTSSMDVVYLHRHCPEIKKTVKNFKICVQFLLTSAFFKAFLHSGWVNFCSGVLYLFIQYDFYMQSA